ncbi:ankyrin repeat domain-containing protein [Nitrospirota bacterium]
MFYAASNGHAEVVKLLIEKGADARAKNSKDETALDFAKRGKHKKAAKILKKAM